MHNWKKWLSYGTFAAISICFTIYSYALVDPNFTLVNSAAWTQFRNVMVQIGYHQRPTSLNIYLALLLGLSTFHFYAVLKKKNALNPLVIAGIAIVCLILSYNFLSRDIFNYIFDAKILTTYGDNPYLHKALDYPNDEWTRFMHYTHRTYPYGPTFLALTLIPSFVAGGIFILNFLFFKGMNLALYFIATVCLAKIDRKKALFFATHPLIIIDGLINSHNDFVAVTIGIIAITMFYKKNQTRLHQFFSRFLLLFSGLVKYFTIPAIILPTLSASHDNPKYKNQRIWLSLCGILVLVVGMSFNLHPYTWYWLNLFIFLPYFKHLLLLMSPILVGSLLTYSGLILYGDGAKEGMILGNTIWYYIIALQVALVIVLYLKKKLPKQL